MPSMAARAVTAYLTGEVPDEQDNDSDSGLRALARTLGLDDTMELTRLHAAVLELTRAKGEETG